MRKVVLLAWLLLFFAACQKHEDEIAPADLPDARLNKALTGYKTLLTGSEHGWKGMLRTGRGEVYNFLFKFTAGDRVIMSSDINASTEAPLESSYRLKAMQHPSLLFDTYSYLHILADPDSRKNGGDVGQGRYVDFEFNIESATDGAVTLVGQHHGSRLTLTRASQAEAANYIKNIVAQATALANLNTFTTYFKRLSIGAKAYDIRINTANRTITFIYFTGETAQTFTTSFSYTDQGVVLMEPFTQDGQNISLLQGLQFNPNTRQLSFTINNAAATIQEASRPVKVDVQGTRNFVNTATREEYWVGLTGFTINGVPDAIKFADLPNYYFLVLWPKFGTSNNMAYDLLGFVKRDASNSLELAYGPAAVSQVTFDGRLVYNYLGLLGDVPEQEQPTVTAARQIWTDPQGFYVMRYGGDEIDLVSAKDGKSWISLFKP